MTKRGRPPLPSKDRSTKQVHFRCTTADKSSYRRKAKRDTGKPNISVWLKGLADKA